MQPSVEKYKISNKVNNQSIALLHNSEQ